MSDEKIYISRCTEIKRYLFGLHPSFYFVDLCRMIKITKDHCTRSVNNWQDAIYTISRSTIIRRPACFGRPWISMTDIDRHLLVFVQFNRLRTTADVAIKIYPRSIPTSIFQRGWFHQQDWPRYQTYSNFPFFSGSSVMPVNSIHSRKRAYACRCRRYLQFDWLNSTTDQRSSSSSSPSCHQSI